MSSQFSVVIPAAGIGRRMNSDTPKQYLTILNQTVIEHTITRLNQHPRVGTIVVVLHPDDRHFESLAVARLANVFTVQGGDERVDSVLAGLSWLSSHHLDSEWVLVHDAPRPCIPLSDLTELIKLAEQPQALDQSGGILAYRVRDTMKRGSDIILATESREHLWHALTPQFFPLEILINAIEKAQLDRVLITDEASAMEYSGYTVALVEGSSKNIKITSPDDLKLAEFYLSN